MPRRTAAAAEAETAPILSRRIGVGLVFSPDEQTSKHTRTVLKKLGTEAHQILGKDDD